MQDQTPRTEAELRVFVQRRLRRPRLFDGVWGVLIEHEYVKDVLYGAASADWLVDHAKRILDQGRLSEATIETVDSPRPPLGHERAYALSQLVAHNAAEDADIAAFRTTRLDGKLVQWANLEAWISATSAADGEPTMFMKVQLPAGLTTNRVNDGIRLDPPLDLVTGAEFSYETLSYALPNDKAVRRITVNARGKLGALSRLANRAATGFGWQPVQAAVFIVCGVMPLVGRVRATVPALKIHNMMDVAWARRIILDIDPAAGVEDVVSAFRTARGDLGRDRRREQSLKHLRLAAFTGAEHAGKAWSERFRLWNKEFPHWAYSHESNFRRDACTAQQRLLYPVAPGAGP